MLRKNKQTPQEQSDQEFNLALEVPAEQRPKGCRYHLSGKRGGAPEYHKRV